MYKFRAWLEAEKQMIQHREVIERAHYMFGDSLNIEDTVMQYIGIVDKNGKEIYEGDILRRDPLRNGKVLEGVVEYEWKEYCCFDSDCEWEDILNYREEVIEVIGNIYEKGNKMVD